MVEISLRYDCMTLYCCNCKDMTSHKNTETTKHGLSHIHHFCLECGEEYTIDSFK